MWANISGEAKSLTIRLLERDPKNRLGSKQALKSILFHLNSPRDDSSSEKSKVIRIIRDEE